MHIMLLLHSQKDGIITQQGIMCSTKEVTCHVIPLRHCLMGIPRGSQWANQMGNIALFFQAKHLPQNISCHIRDLHIDGLVQDCSISSALAKEILQSCTKPSI